MRSCRNQFFINFQLVDVFLCVTSFYCNSVFSYCNFPGHRTYNERLKDLPTFSLSSVSRGMWRSWRACTIEQILLSKKMLKVNNQYTKTRCEIIPSSKNKKHYQRRNFGAFIIKSELILTPSSITSMFNFKPVFVYLDNSQCYFFIQKLRYQSWCFSQESPSQKFLQAANKRWYKKLKPVKYIFRDAFIHWFFYELRRQYVFWYLTLTRVY